MYLCQKSHFSSFLHFTFDLKINRFGKNKLQSRRERGIWSKKWTKKIILFCEKKCANYNSMPNFSFLEIQKILIIIISFVMVGNNMDVFLPRKTKIVTLFSDYNLVDDICM